MVAAGYDDCEPPSSSVEGEGTVGLGGGAFDVVPIAAVEVDAAALSVGAAAAVGGTS